MGIVEKFLGKTRYLEQETPGKTQELLLLVHGSGGAADVWRPILGRFRAVHPIAIDLPAHGKTPGPCLTSVEASVDFIEDFRRQLGAERIVILGHSLGGATTQLYAYKHPNRCLAAVIASSGTTFTADPARTEKVRTDWASCVDHYANGQVSPRASAEARTEARRMVEARDPQIFATDLVTCRGWDSRAWLHAVKPPCLVLVGREDPLTPPEKSLEIYETIRHAELEVVGPAGHSPFLEHPARYVAAIEGFVEAVLEKSGRRPRP
ncbi:alpha/beta fold hydrolase [Pseudochelatococcus sp. B33]